MDISQRLVACLSIQKVTLVQQKRSEQT